MVCSSQVIGVTNTKIFWHFKLFASHLFFIFHWWVLVWVCRSMPRCPCGTQRSMFRSKLIPAWDPRYQTQIIRLGGNNLYPQALSLAQVLIFLNGFLGHIWQTLEVACFLLNLLYTLHIMPDRQFSCLPHRDPCSFCVLTLTDLKWQAELVPCFKSERAVRKVINVIVSSWSRRSKLSLIQTSGTCLMLITLH